jgi:hypothetical protein
MWDALLGIAGSVQGNMIIPRVSVKEYARLVTIKAQFKLREHWDEGVRRSKWCHDDKYLSVDNIVERSHIAEMASFQR